MKNKINTTTLKSEDFATLAICAIRYCHDRQTYMPSLIREIIAPHVSELSDKDLAVMIDDCDYQARMHLYGDDKIDKTGWLAWRQYLLDVKSLREK